MSNIIECKNVSHYFQDGDTATKVLADLNFTIKKNNKVAILGSSGSGKSTLLNLLGGLDIVKKGEIFLNNINLKNINEARRTKLRSKHLGFVYQFHHLLVEFSALDNVAMPLLIQNNTKAKSYEKAQSLLDAIGLNHRLNHRPSELSGGERQRVAIARALITNPDCILADEPTGNLDKNNAKNVFDMMLNLSNEKQTSLIIVTHDEKLARKMDNVFILKDYQLRQIK